MALVAALGIMFVLTISAVSVIAYTATNEGSARRSVAEQTAFALAEAGFNEAVAVLANSSNPLSSSALPPGTATHEGGSVSWSGTLAGDIWAITAVSTVRNPTGAADLHRTVRGQMRVQMDPNSMGNEAWNYLFADDTSTCTTLKNSVTIGTPFYVRGNLCLENSAKVTGSPLNVGGTITVSNVASVGTSSVPLGTAHVRGGCRYGASGPYVSPCGPHQRVWVTTLDASPGTITKPPIDLLKWYAESKPGPLRTCTTGSFPGGFDNNTVMDRSLPTVILTPPTAYDCSVTVGSTVVGRIAWTPGSPGVLRAMGVIFFDGDVLFTGNTQAVYSGRGTIYSSGRIELSNSAQLCGVQGCSLAGWNPNENLLLFVAGSSTDANGFWIRSNTVFQGAIYAVTDFREENGAIMQGPAIARQLYFENTAQTSKWIPIWALAPGAPSVPGAMTLTPVADSWSG